MKKILPFLLAAAVFLTPLYPVYAQTTTNTATPTVKRIIRPAAASAAAGLKAVAQGRIEDRKEMVQGRIENIQDRIASRAAELKTKLAKFKDKVKAGRVERINTNLNVINERRTSQMKSVLEQISKLLEKFKTKSAEAAASGKDTAPINAAILQVEAAIAEADAAIKAQAEKDYSIVVNTESTVRTDAQTARDSLRNDLKMLHDKMVSLRQSLANAISTAKSSLGGQTNGTEQ